MKSSKLACGIWVATLTTSLVIEANLGVAGTTWDGGGGADANWTTAANWNGDTLPAFNGTDAITFGTPAGASGTNTLLNGDKNISSLIITTATGFTINNNQLTLQSGNISGTGAGT